MKMQLYTTTQVRELDRIAIQEFGIKGYTLMQRAGKEIFETLLKFWPKVQNLTIVCGKGNNAGDGYVVARLAQMKNIRVKVLYLNELGQLSGDAKLAAEDCIKSGVVVKPYSVQELKFSDVVVDALFGSGLQGEVQGDFKAAIEAINFSHIDVLAIDIPSGLNADTGNPLGVAIKAKATVTLVGRKQGLFTGQAKDYCGEIIFSDLDIPTEVYARIKSEAEVLQLEDFKIYLPPRIKSTNKGAYGHVLIIGGDYGMAGAVRMAGEAAARVGAGLVTIATRSEHIAAVSGSCPELMCYGVNNVRDLEKLIAKATVLVVGPGLGSSLWSKELCQLVMDSKYNQPKVIDADALNWLANSPKKSTNWILTPHPGEAARLLKCQVSEVQKDRFSAVRNIQNIYGGVSILKGAGSLVVGDSGNVGVCVFGNPGMASGGMGDVLSGVIGGFLAQGLPLEIAGDFGVLVHSKAADLAVLNQGERGLLATDLFNYLKKLVN